MDNKMKIQIDFADEEVKKNLERLLEHKNTTDEQIKKIQELIKWHASMKARK